MARLCSLVVLVCAMLTALVMTRAQAQCTFNVQPVGGTFCQGDNVTLTASVVLGSGPITWRRNGTVVGTGNVLNLGAASTAIAGTYVASSNGVFGTPCTSNGAVVNVQIPAVIQADPGSVSRCLGANASLSVTVNADASPAPTYQWRKGAVNLTNGGRISGATSATLTITGLVAGDDASNYNCVVTHPCGNSTSSNGAISVDSPVVINSITASNPNPICSNETTTLTVTHTGSAPFTYVWKRGTVTLVNGAVYSGQGTASLTITNPTPSGVNGTYTCTITNACSTNVVSAGLIITVQTAPVIGVQPPPSVKVCAGGSVTIPVTATATPTPTYQWRKGGVNLADGGAFAGTNTPMLTISSASAAEVGSYDCVVSTNGCSRTTNASALSLYTPIAITTQPATQQKNPPMSVTFAVVAAGDFPAYQWRRNGVNISNGGRYSGATSASLTINPTQTSDYADVFDCVVTGPCNAVTSDQASIWQCDQGEVEPNDNKAGATAITMTPGQTICGSTTGNSGTGATSRDYFKINLPQLPGITQYELALVSETAHGFFLQGLTQTAGVPNVNSDASLNAATIVPFGRPTLRWYGLGTSAPSVYISVIGSATTPSPYALQLSARSITPETLAGPALARGTISISTATGDTDIWVYDVSLNPIVGYGNDDPPTGIGAATLTRTYTGGTYYLALSQFNLANNLGSPSDDNFRSGVVMDFPGVTACGSVGTGSLSGSIGGRAIPAAPHEVFGIRWIKFTVSCNAADIASLGGALGSDGQLTADDLVAYLAAFFNMNTAVADIVGLGGAPNPPDGQITADDLVYFLNQYFAGCN